MATKINLRDLENSTSAFSIVQTDASNIAKYTNLPLNANLATDASGNIISSTTILKKYVFDFVSADWVGGNTIDIPLSTHNINSKDLHIKLYEVIGAIATEVFTSPEIHTSTLNVKLRISAPAFNGYAVLIG